MFTDDGSDYEIAKLILGLPLGLVISITRLPRLESQRLSPTTSQV